MSDESFGADECEAEAPEPSEPPLKEPVPGSSYYPECDDKFDLLPLYTEIH